MLDPIAFNIGPIAVHWYGLLYGIALLLAFLIIRWLNQKQKVFKKTEQLLDFLFWVFLVGVVVGGRLGYVLFYNFGYYASNPWDIFAIWQGGMSFHGGLLGVVLVGYWYAKKMKLNFLKLADMVVVAGALGQAIGRFGNLINGELPGRVIANPDWVWLAYDFGDELARYPSPIFQSLSLFLLFVALLLLFRKRPQAGTILFSYLAIGGILRFITEFWREPDGHIGFIIDSITLGQLLSMAVTIVGIGGLFWLRRR